MQCWEWRGCGSSDPGITVKPMMGEQAKQVRPMPHNSWPFKRLSRWVMGKITRKWNNRLIFPSRS